MRFSCGETWDAKLKRLSNWHPYFAWYPVSVAVENDRHVCAWLETVWRKGEFHRFIEISWWDWEYRKM